MNWLFGMMMLPMMVGRGKRYFEWQAASLFIALLALMVWTAAPIAIWNAYGIGWTLFWLIPTGSVVCMMGYSRGMAGGG
jgi:hypothetical protein